MKTSVKTFALMLVAATMAGCSSTDMYDETLIEENAKLSYSDNFSRKYPNVDLNQSWDFSTKTPTISFGTSTAASARTRAGEGGFTASQWYEVDNNTLAWMHNQLTEGNDHRNLGTPFVMSVPGNEFTIVPIYQGVAGAMWDLHVVVDGVDYKVWEKINYETLGGHDGQDEHLNGTIQIKDLDSDQWHNLHGQWYDWGYGHWNSLYNTDGSDRWTPDWSQPNTVTAVRSTAYTFKNLPVGAEMYFYLDITEDGNDRENGRITAYRNSVGDKMTSYDGMMRALQDCPVPANLTGNEVMIIGCEDANGSASDWDMNDLVLLVYGTKVPKPREITEGDTMYESVTVRYMIEDLGATDDFDFNDIVIDMVETTAKTPTLTNGVVTSWTDNGTTQTAIIRHLGGTLPFQLRLGNTQLEEHAGVLGSNPNERYEISGWNMNTHNISVQVQQNGNNGVYNHVVFPRAGEAPMIIAVDPTQSWMGERQSVPESWFYVPAGE